MVRGDLKRVHGLGQGMTSGRLHVMGDVGDRLGAGISGGSIELEGNCGDLAGAGNAWWAITHQRATRATSWERPSPVMFWG